MGKRNRNKGASKQKAKPQSQASPAGQAIWPLAALLFVAGFIAFFPTLKCGSIWDDPEYLLNNAHLRTASGLWKIWSFSLFEDGVFHPRCNTPQYYPLVFTSFWIEYGLFGLHFPVYHLTNLVLHLLSALLLWRLLGRLSVPGAWIAATVFALHPVQVESVAWIT
ncbi:MAG: hypothetical protein KJ645_01870 [Planctomycetes bacterium]|nr:hypothetical protein [Planctomycetota bacterium]